MNTVQRQLRGLAIAAHYYRTHPPVYERGIITEAWRRRHRPRRCCRWCNERVVTLKRWHAACLQAYTVARGEAKTRSKKKVIDVGACARCGATEAIQIDHIIPLGLARLRGKRAYIRAHLIDNLQPLCVTCHQSKTGSDRARMFEAKRGQLVLWGEDWVAQRGIARDSTAQDSATRDGTAQDSTARDGTARDSA